MQNNDLKAAVAAVPHWHHSIDLGGGLVTQGVKSLDVLRNEWQAMCIPNLAGRSVLDIGAWDGWFSFEAERHGAARVVSLDHFVWSLDFSATNAYFKEKRDAYLENVERAPCWHPDTLPGKRGYDLAHRALNSRAEVVVADYIKVDPNTIGKFDVVLYLGVLYHTESPLQSLKQLAKLTKGTAIIETAAVEIRGREDLELFEFHSGKQLGGDITNWWSPTIKGLQGMCHAAGFSKCEVKQGPPRESRKKWLARKFGRSPGHVRYRAIVHVSV